MTMTLTIIALAFAYALVVALLVGLFAAGRVHAIWRIGAAMLAVGLFFVTYYGIGELRGLPSDSPLPRFFKLHWARIVEPNQILNEPGRIYLWIEELDADNYPSGLPRAYLVPYTADLVRQVDAALAEIEGGKDVAGRIADAEEAADTAERLAEDVAQRVGQGPDGSGLGEKVLHMDFGELSFGPMPAPVTPQKPL
ncbi:MAG TPA: hypothetical protein GYA10_08325 [Alphaproteobacteria bacterium]|nr:hypothetical protein [Alphaproteobacteria bacterium]